MNRRGRKMIAPIIISVLFVLYFLGLAAVWAILEMPILVKMLFVIVPLGLAGVMIGVVISRIKEIRSGEEDDLSKY